VETAHIRPAGMEAWEAALHAWPALQPCEALRQTGEHSAALETLEKMTEADGEGADGPSGDEAYPLPRGMRSMVAYLGLLGCDNAELFFRFARRLVRQHPETALPVCTTTRPAGILPIDIRKIATFLQEEAPSLLVPVLERLHANQFVASSVPKESGDASEAPENGTNCLESACLLVDAYASRLREISSRGADIDVRACAPHNDDSYTDGASEQRVLVHRLNELIVSCGSIPPDGVRSMLKSLEPPSAWTADEQKGIGSRNTLEEERHTNRGWLVAARSELLARLKRHTDALRLLARDAREPRLAERYCKKYAGGDVDALHLALLEVYLKDQPPMVSEALELLRVHGGTLEPGAVFSIIPLDLQLSEVAPVIACLFERATARRRDAQLLRALHKARSVQLHADLLSKRAANVVITAQSACATCSKAVGGAPFCTSRTGELRHASCQLRTACSE